MPRLRARMSVMPRSCLGTIRDAGEPLRTPLLVPPDDVLMRERRGDVVEALDQARAGVRVEREDRVQLERGSVECRRGDVDAELDLWIAFDAAHQARDDLGWQRNGQEAGADGVIAENVPEARRDDRLEAVLGQSPRGMLARAAAAKVRAGD